MLDILYVLSLLLGLAASTSLIWLIIRAFRKHLLWGLSVLLFSPVSATAFGIRHWNEEKKPFLAYLSTFTTAVALGMYVFTAWGGWDVVRTSLRVNQGIHEQTLTEQDAMAFMQASLNFIEKTGPGEQELEKLDLMRKFLDKYESDMTVEEQLELNNEILGLIENGNLSAEEQQALGTMRRKLQQEITRAAKAAAANEDQETREDTTPGKVATRRPSNKPKNQRAEYIPIEVADAKNYIGKTFKVMRSNGVEKQVILRGAPTGKLRFEERTRGGNLTYNYHRRDITKLRLLAWQTY